MSFLHDMKERPYLQRAWREGVHFKEECYKSKAQGVWKTFSERKGTNKKSLSDFIKKKCVFVKSEGKGSLIVAGAASKKKKTTQKTKKE